MRALFLSFLLVSTACTSSNPDQEGDAGVAEDSGVARPEGPPLARTDQQALLADAAAKKKALPGEPCQQDSDCQGDQAVCFTDIPGGYCLIMGCKVGGTECPSGSICIAGKSTTACVKGPCKSDSECARSGAAGFVCDKDHSCWWYKPQTCTPESNPAFCSRFGAECGQLSALDNCGSKRTVSCGGCTSGSCINNTCPSCTPESDAALCSRKGVTCGR